MAARSIAYHAHGTADGDKFCCYPWLVCHDINSAMHCSLRLAPTMINHLTSNKTWRNAYHPSYTCTDVHTPACPGPWHLYSSVKLFEVDHVGRSPFVSRITHKRQTYFGGHGASTYRSHIVRILVLSRTQLNSSPVVGFLENMAPLNTAVDLKSLHSQFRRATVRHALKALQLRHSVAWLRHKYSSKSPNLNFANIKIQPFFAISPNLMPAKFSCYTVSHKIHPLQSLILLATF